jgi:uncharacterized membrane protein
MEAHLRAGEYAQAVCDGIDRISALVARHYPARPGEPNELPDQPVRV